MIISFGYKHGVPDTKDKKVTVDVRNLPNPYTNIKLRHLKGDAKEVIEYIESFPSTETMYRQIKNYIVLPYYNYMDIYVGCTGGHHRSVYIANRLAKDLGVEVMHRDYEKE